MFEILFNKIYLLKITINSKNLKNNLRTLKKLSLMLNCMKKFAAD